MGGGPGAGGVLIQYFLVMLIAIPAHLLSYRYWRKHFIVRYLLTSLLIAVVALLIPISFWLNIGNRSYPEPMIWKYFLLNLFVAFLAGIPLIGVYLRERK
ncbi:hypothetical protein [uncultured Gimesia sp.]|uniref:hypothetical protein n=1 Tax=uncultured Gimesia sp. TaxID=1678688 RepID=UPI00262F9730|nr:hypothetical protein [uncultured Gimesia sp.]